MTKNNSKRLSKKKKDILSREKGFTLIELLLVMAIIGILVATVYIGLGGQRERTRAHSALESVRSALPYVVDCYMKNGVVQAPANGGAICSLALGMNYPAIGTGSTDGCLYTSGGGATNAPIVITCDGGVITCDYDASANCVLN